MLNEERYLMLLLLVGSPRTSLDGYVYYFARTVTINLKLFHI